MVDFLITSSHPSSLLFVLQEGLRAIVIGTGVTANAEVIADAIRERAALCHPQMKSLPTIQAETGDSAIGGCMFSAAELDASKSYIQQPDGSWCVAYQVTIVCFVILNFCYSVCIIFL
jgi:hypothetical protein